VRRINTGTRGESENQKVVSRLSNVIKEVKTHNRCGNCW
jgi:hypothetical protein